MRPAQPLPWLSRQITTVMSLEPDTAAVLFGSRWWSWRDLNVARREVDQHLSGVGNRAGDAVGVVLRNDVDSLAGLLAVLATGRCVVSLNPAQAKNRLREEVRSLEVSAIIASEQDSALVRSATNGLTISIAEGAVNCSGKIDEVGEGSHRPGEAIELLTSGTTGTPKRIPVSYSVLEHTLRARPTTGRVTMMFDSDPEYGSAGPHWPTSAVSGAPSSPLWKVDAWS